MQSIRVDIRCHWIMGQWRYEIRATDEDYPTAAETFTVMAGQVSVSERETELGEAAAILAAISADVAEHDALPGVG